MRVGIIGGHDRNHVRYHELAHATGDDVEFHDGHMRGRASEALDALVERCDVVVVVTRINSHGAVRLARQLVRKRGRDILIVPRFGLRHFEELLRHQERVGTWVLCG